MKIYSV